MFMRKALLGVAALLCLSMFLVVNNVWAPIPNNYVSDKVGGVLSPTNSVMSLTLAVFLCVVALGFVAAFGYFRMR
jgi:uncharacterized membrane protein YoaK (UPF0700 family)